MIFHFTINGDCLEMIRVKEEAYTGNVNSYSCLCEFDGAWDGLEKFAVFSNGEESVTLLVPEENEVIIPAEMIKAGKRLLVGFYADSLSEQDFKRISTGFAEIRVEAGAYRDGLTSPEIPEPDLWEKLVNRNVPQIGENGNWQLWDLSINGYRDSGIAANPGMAEVRQNTANALTKRTVVGGTQIELTDISPLEHIIEVKTRQKNMFNARGCVEGCDFASASEDGSTITLSGGTGSETAVCALDEVIPKGSSVTVSIGEYTSDTASSSRLTIYLQGENDRKVRPISIRGNITDKVYSIPNMGFDVYGVYIYWGESAGNARSAVLKNVQLEYGTEATAYEPYIENFSPTVTDSGSGKEFKADADGLVRVQSVSPGMVMQTDMGIIDYVEYNQAVEAVIKAEGEEIKGLINENTAAIAELQSMTAGAGYIEQEAIGAGGSLTIGQEAYGIYMVTGTDSTVSYTCSEGGSISKSGRMHIFIKSQRKSNDKNCMTHMQYGSDFALDVTQSYPVSDVTVINNDTSGGMEIIRLPMRSPK